MRYGVTARRKRNMRRVAELAELRRERREARRAVGLANMVVQEARPSGALAVEAERISKSYEGKTIVRDFSLRDHARRQDRRSSARTASGKTTLINLLTGAIAPDSGTVRVGSNVLMASLDQTRGSLQPTTTLVDALTGGGSDSVTINGERRHVIGYMEDFLFGARTGPHADRQIVGRRARPPDAGQRPGGAVESAGARRADQRPRHRDAGPVAGAARRLCGNDPDRQPRSRLSRSRRDFGDRQRGRRAVDRICRRLFRYGGAARLWSRRPGCAAPAGGGREARRPGDGAGARRSAS